MENRCLRDKILGAFHFTEILEKFVLLEASKKILEYLAAISANSEDVVRIKNRLLQCNPVLEVCQQNSLHGLELRQ